MRLDSLCVIHLKKDLGKDLRIDSISSSETGREILSGWNPPSIESQIKQENVFYLETCQRKVWISAVDPWIDLNSRSLKAQGANLLKGQQAYAFLVRLASGLESEILGETDIFGQIKEAWKKAIQNQSDQPAQKSRSICPELGTLKELAPWMQKIFEDTKEIRTEYLQNLGGSSYGTLVRKLMKDHFAKVSSNANLGNANLGRVGEPILLVGAGQIAESVAPILLDSELWLWNRSPERLQSLYSQLSQRPRTRIRKIETEQEEQQAWKQAACIVLCIPNASADSAVDRAQTLERISWIKEANSSSSAKKLVIHLGGIRNECQDWTDLPNFFSLSELFALQNSLGNVRSLQVGYARAACEQRSILRAMGSSLSIPHGWEDLACFS